MPGRSYADVVARLRPGAFAPGDIVDLDGRVLGRHDGIAGYTVGQRRGLGLGGGAPRYVVRIEPAANRIVVGPRAALAVARLRLREVNWLHRAPAGAAGMVATIKVRSAGAGRPGRVRDSGEGAAEVVLETAERGVAPARRRSSTPATACSAAAGSPPHAVRPSWRPTRHPARHRWRSSGSRPATDGARPDTACDPSRSVQLGHVSRTARASLTGS